MLAQSGEVRRLQLGARAGDALAFGEAFWWDAGETMLLLLRELCSLL